MRASPGAKSATTESTTQLTSTAVQRTALLTGLAYAGLAVTGLLGYFAIHSQLYVQGDASSTAGNLLASQGLARFGIAVDLAAVLAQALTAVWFYKLFRGVDPFAAASIAAFGMVNAAIMLVGTVFFATALDVAIGTAGGGSVDRASTALLMYDLHGTAWRAGALFFGLWLIPMGWCALRSTFMPSRLGKLLVVGGVGYIVSAFIDFLVKDASSVVYALTLPATVGELWMVGYLLVKGLTPVGHASVPWFGGACTASRHPAH